jgi:hypothetical protein
MDILTVVGTGIRSTLLANANIAMQVNDRVWQMVAPGGAELPYILFYWQGGGELNSTQRETFDLVFLVAAVAETQVKAREIASYIQTALKNQEVLFPDGYSAWSPVRETDPYLDVSNVQNRQYWIAGAVYRFRGIK